MIHQNFQWKYRKFRKKTNTYTIIEQIGSGSFGTVYKVRDNSTNEYFAAKVLSINNNAEQYERNLNEIELMIYLQHPTIIKFQGYSLTDFVGLNNFTIFTDLCEKGSLYDLLINVRSGNGDHDYDNTMRQKILVGISRGMMYLHQHQVIHRDLKPGNILLDNEFNPLITDFGLSKKYSIGYEMVQSISFCGSIIYMAPEVFNSKKYGTSADVYSFGIIMYEIVTNDFPYPLLESGNISIADFPNMVINENYRPTFKFKINKNLQQLIQRCWDGNPDQRPTFEEIFNKLAYSVDDDDYYLEDVDEDELLSYVDLITKDDINEENYMLKKSIEDLVNKLNDNQIEIEKLKNENKILNVQINEAKEQNEQLAKQINDSKKKNEQHEEQINDSKKKNEQHEEQINDSKKKNEQHEEQLNDIKEQNEQHEEQTNDAKEQNEQHEEQINDSKEQNEQHEEQTNDSKEQNEQHEEQINDSKEQNEQHEEQINDAEVKKVKPLNIKNPNKKFQFTDGLKNFKVVLVGESYVGKTCIIKRFIYDIYDIWMGGPLLPTSYEYKFEDKCILNICDFTGATCGESFMPLYLKNADAVIFVCSYDLESSVSTLRDYFCPLVFDNLPFFAPFLAVNKSDMNFYTREFLNDSQIENFKNELEPLGFFHVSAETYENIYNLFECVALNLCDLYKEEEILNVSKKCTDDRKSCEIE